MKKSDFRSKYGVKMFSDSEPVKPEDLVKTGSEALDEKLGGGFVIGRVGEIYGDEGTGKTTLALTTVAETQKIGGRCLFVDVEHKLNIEYAEALGVDPKTLEFTQPDSAEGALNLVIDACKSKEYRLIVLDSVAALVPKAEEETDIGSAHMGLIARLMGQFQRKALPYVLESGTFVFFINQVRSTMSGGNPYAKKTDTTGGAALKYMACFRIECRRSKAIKNSGDEIIGHILAAKVVKNKFYPPFKTAETPLIYGVGFDNLEMIIDLAIDMGLIDKSGAWFTYGDLRTQGKEKLKQSIKDENLIDKLKKEIEEVR